MFSSSKPVASGWMIPARADKLGQIEASEIAPSPQSKESRVFMTDFFPKQTPFLPVQFTVKEFFGYFRFSRPGPAALVTNFISGHGSFRKVEGAEERERFLAGLRVSLWNSSNNDG